MDKNELEQNGLLNLRFGDVVALQDCDTTNGRCFRKGAVTIGVVVHSDCVLSGHGPGVTTIITSQTNNIEYHLNNDANIANIMEPFMPKSSEKIRKALKIKNIPIQTIVAECINALTGVGAFIASINHKLNGN